MRILTDNAGALRTGAWITVQLTLLSFAAGLLLGAVVAIMRVSPLKPLRAAGSLYVASMVNTPAVFLAFFAFYGLPKLGFLVSPFVTAVVTMSLYVGGFIAEAIRSGINTVPNGQAEAARAIGLTFSQNIRHVVLPQALRSSFGPLGVILNANFRNVAVAGAIGVNELVKVQRVLGEGINPVDGRNLDTVAPFTFALCGFAFFLVIGLAIGAAVSRLDAGLAVKR
jgi:glutamate transport system permease protein